MHVFSYVCMSVECVRKYCSVCAVSCNVLVICGEFMPMYVCIHTSVYSMYMCVCLCLFVYVLTCYMYEYKAVVTVCSA